MDGELTHIQLACFSLGEKLFAVDIVRIREIIRPQLLAPLPCSSDLLEGVINLRGTVIPVMSMRNRFGMPPAERNSSGKLLVVALRNQLLALDVDDVMEVVTVPVEAIKPPIQSAHGIGMEFILGVFIFEEKLFMIINIDNIMNADESRHESAIERHHAAHYGACV